jgi:hypothetical protein
VRLYLSSNSFRLSIWLRFILNDHGSLLSIPPATPLNEASVCSHSSQFPGFEEAVRSFLRLQSCCQGHRCAGPLQIQSSLSDSPNQSAARRYALITSRQLQRLHQLVTRTPAFKLNAVP